MIEKYLQSRNCLVPLVGPAATVSVPAAHVASADDARLATDKFLRSYSIKDTEAIFDWFDVDIEIAREKAKAEEDKAIQMVEEDVNMSDSDIANDLEKRKDVKDVIDIDDPGIITEEVIDIDIGSKKKKFEIIDIDNYSKKKKSDVINKDIDSSKSKKEFIDIDIKSSKKKIELIDIDIESSKKKAEVIDIDIVAEKIHETVTKCVKLAHKDEAALVIDDVDHYLNKIEVAVEKEVIRTGKPYL